MSPLTGEVFLETPRLRLRRFTADDADLLVAIDADPEVMLFITGGAATPRQEVVDEVLPAFLSYHERFAGYGFWALEERATGAFLGWVHYRPRPDDPPDQPELGYRSVRSAWGQGYTAEASQAVIDHGFQELGVRRVVAETMSVNGASRRVMEKVGMRLVREFVADWPVRIPGDEHGDVEYAITREEWLACRWIRGGCRVGRGLRAAAAAGGGRCAVGRCVGRCAVGRCVGRCAVGSWRQEQVSGRAGGRPCRVMAPPIGRWRVCLTVDGRRRPVHALAGRSHRHDPTAGPAPPSTTPPSTPDRHPNRT